MTRAQLEALKTKFGSPVVPFANNLTSSPDINPISDDDTTVLNWTTGIPTVYSYQNELKPGKKVLRGDLNAIAKMGTEGIIEQINGKRYFFNQDVANGLPGDGGYGYGAFLDYFDESENTDGLLHKIRCINESGNVTTPPAKNLLSLPNMSDGNWQIVDYFDTGYGEYPDIEFGEETTVTITGENINRTFIESSADGNYIYKFYLRSSVVGDIRHNEGKSHNMDVFYRCFLDYKQNGITKTIAIVPYGSFNRRSYSSETEYGHYTITDFKISQARGLYLPVSSGTSFSIRNIYYTYNESTGLYVRNRTTTTIVKYSVSTTEILP